MFGGGGQNERSFIGRDKKKFENETPISNPETQIIENHQFFAANNFDKRIFIDLIILLQIRFPEGNKNNTTLV